MLERALRRAKPKSASLTKTEARPSNAKQQTLSQSPSRRGDSVQLSSADLKRFAQEWLFDCQYRQHSKSTIQLRQLIVNNLLWFVDNKESSILDAGVIKRFLHYMQHGHEEEGGRWGKAHLTRPVRPRTIKDYHCHLRTLFRWMQAEEIIESSPMERIAPPIARADQIQPFTPEHIESLLDAAKYSTHPRRNKAIILLLLDTGMRASEMCGLRVGDLDMQGQNCRVLGKGNKHRTVYFGRNAAKSLASYLREERREADYPLFPADAGTRAKEGLTRSGLRQVIRRLSKTAGISGVRCSPHTFRHTCAIEFLRAGGNVFTLKELYGHTSLHMTQRYVALAQADIEKQHRQFSPADRLRKGG